MLTVETTRQLNTRNAAIYLGIKPKSLYAAMERGAIKAERGVNGRLVFPIAVLDAYLESRGLLPYGGTPAPK